MIPKTIKELNGTVWYRLIKSLCLLGFLLCAVIYAVGLTSYIISYSNGEIITVGDRSVVFDFIFVPPILFLVFETIRRFFYYIVMGKSFPPKG